jgi:integrase
MRPSGDIECSRPRKSGRWFGRRREQARLIFLTAAFLRLRMGGLLALRWRDVDFAGSVIRVRQLRRRASDHAGVGEGAGGCRWRLMSHRRWGAWPPGAVGGSDDRVFVGSTGGYLDGLALRRRVRRRGCRPARVPGRKRDPSRYVREVSAARRAALAWPPRWKRAGSGSRTDRVRRRPHGRRKCPSAARFVVMGCRRAGARSS